MDYDSISYKLESDEEYTPNIALPFVAVWSGDPEKDIIKIGKGTILRDNTIIIHYGTTIGRNCSIGYNVFIRENTIIGDNTTIGTMTDIEGDCKIGNDCNIHSQNHIGKMSTIEDHVFIAPMCCLTNTNKIKHGRLYPLKMEGVTIGYGSRIGVGVIFGPGIKIGRECMIGMGSVVTSNTTPFGIYYGNPAKFIKFIPDDEKL